MLYEQIKKDANDGMKKAVDSLKEEYLQSRLAEQQKQSLMV